MPEEKAKLNPKGIFSPIFLDRPPGMHMEGDQPWGESNPGYWFQAGPPWVQGGDMFHMKDKIFVDFQSTLNPELLGQLSKLDLRIIKGSMEDGKWRLMANKGDEAKVSEILRKSGATAIKRFSTTAVK